ncbi:hypothetical protein FGG78_20715 [Thioclava sp. BHET1]|nr:hypothetical protein FGG78_20715 [Thioclava sp. BHET1]
MLFQIEDRLARLRDAARHKTLEERAELILEEARAVGRALQAHEDAGYDIHLHGLSVTGDDPFDAALIWWAFDGLRAAGHKVAA